jgi:uncharacterized protein YjbJ (UPF0337 family)
MIYTTLNAIRKHDPCQDSWRKLLAHLGKTKADNARLPFAVIVEACGLDDALWATRVAPRHKKTWRLYAVWCGRQVQHLMTDARSVAALDVAERYANGKATTKELAAAWDAAWDAAWAGWHAAGAARDAAGAARDAARDAAWAAAWAAAGAARDAAGAARDAAWDAARDAARDAAWAAAWAAAWDAAREAQKAEFLRVVL